MVEIVFLNMDEGGGKGVDAKAGFELAVVVVKGVAFKSRVLMLQVLLWKKDLSEAELLV